MEVQYMNAYYPYNTSGSFMEYFEGLTYDHVNFIFSYEQESLYPLENTNYYKFGLLEPESYFCYDDGQDYEVNSHVGDYFENRSSTMATDDHTAATARGGWDGSANSSSHANAAVCPRRHQNIHDHQGHDNVNPDDMTYEELVDLGETVGSQSRGLSKELISLLPVSKYKCSFFSRRKSRHDRCVICQMEYKRREHQMILPCKHIYHAGCISRWLTINKACPICFTNVSVVAPPAQVKTRVWSM